jgi:hypothetical protein
MNETVVSHGGVDPAVNPAANPVYPDGAPSGALVAVQARSVECVAPAAAGTREGTWESGKRASGW